jgi:hypothetical protein
MVIVDCPWCEAPVALDRPDVLRCDDCAVEVAIDPLPAVEIALAA